MLIQMSAILNCTSSLIPRGTFPLKLSKTGGLSSYQSNFSKIVRSFRTHNISLVDTIMKQINPAHTLTFHLRCAVILLTIHFKIIHSFGSSICRVISTFTFPDIYITSCLLRAFWNFPMCVTQPSLCNHPNPYSSFCSSQYCSREQIEKIEIAGECATYGGDERFGGETRRKETTWNTNP